MKNYLPREIPREIHEERDHTNDRVCSIVSVELAHSEHLDDDEDEAQRDGVDAREVCKPVQRKKKKNTKAEQEWTRAWEGRKKQERNKQEQEQEQEQERLMLYGDGVSYKMKNIALPTPGGMVVWKRTEEKGNSGNS